MPNQKSYYFHFSALIIAVLCMFLVNIASGSVSIPVKEVINSVFGFKVEKETWNYIILSFRLPKAITAVLVGMGLSISGLLMQTLFRNPLAGPYVLGLSSGSSLGVAFVILGAAFLPVSIQPFLNSSFSIIFAAFLGSTLVLAAVVLVAQKLRDTMSILIVGLMFANFTGAIVGVLIYFGSAEQLQKFTFWGLGNLGNLPWSSVATLAGCIFAGLILGVFSIKPLNALLLGENYARSLGLNYKRTQLIIIFATSILASSITAFVGPIAFLGLAVPHIAKLIFQTSNHRILFWATMIFGAFTMLVCDTIAQLPGLDFTLPINAVTSIVGAPVVVWLLLRKRKMIL